MSMAISIYIRPTCVTLWLTIFLKFVFAERKWIYSYKCLYAVSKWYKLNNLYSQYMMINIKLFINHYTFFQCIDTRDPNRLGFLVVWKINFGTCAISLIQFCEQFFPILRRTFLALVPNKCPTVSYGTYAVPYCKLDIISKRSEQ